MNRTAIHLDNPRWHIGHDFEEFLTAVRQEMKLRARHRGDSAGAELQKRTIRIWNIYRVSISVSAARKHKPKAQT